MHVSKVKQPTAVTISNMCFQPVRHWQHLRQRILRYSKNEDRGRSEACIDSDSRAKWFW